MQIFKSVLSDIKWRAKIRPSESNAFCEFSSPLYWYKSCWKLPSCHNNLGTQATIFQLLAFVYDQSFVGCSVLPLNWTVGMLGTLTASVEDASIMWASLLQLLLSPCHSSVQVMLEAQISMNCQKTGYIKITKTAFHGWLLKAPKSLPLDEEFIIFCITIKSNTLSSLHQAWAFRQYLDAPQTLWIGQKWGESPSAILCFWEILFKGGENNFPSHIPFSQVCSHAWTSAYRQDIFHPCKWVTKLSCWEILTHNRTEMMAVLIMQ